MRPVRHHGCMNRALVVAVVGLSLLLAACGEGSSSSKNASTNTPSASGAATAVVGATGGSSAAPVDSGGSLPKLKLERAFGGISFNHMTGMFIAPDGRGRMFVIE